MTRAPLRAAARTVLALALLLLFLGWADPSQVGRRLAGADASWLALGLLLAILSNVASALRWRELARWLGAPVSVRWALRTYFRAISVNALLPGAVVGGDVFRAHALTRERLPLAEAALSVMVDRLGGLWLLVALGLAALAWGLGFGNLDGVLPQRGLPTPPALVAACLTGALVALPFALLAWGRRHAPPPAEDTRWHRRLWALARRTGAMAQCGRQVLGSVAVQVLSVGALAAAGQALGVGLPCWAYAVGAVPTFLMAALPVSFGGWGTREAGAAVAFGALGVAAPQAVGMALLYGLGTLCQALIGAASWLLTGGRPSAPAP